MSKTKNYFSLGIIVSAVYFLFLTGLVFSRAKDISTMELNEWGDTLAGAFGPVAFLWLVLGFLQQREELRLNTMALQLQAHDLSLQTTELRNSVEQQKLLVQSNERQTKLESHRTHISWQPVLILSFHSKVDPGEYGFSQYIINLINMGHLCTNIHIEIQHSYKNGHNLDVPFLQETKTSSFAFTTNIPPNGTLISISFNDGAGERRSQVFVMELRGSFPEPSFSFTLLNPDSEDT